MRKLFVTTLVLSFLGALATGAVYAWDVSNTIGGSAPVGNAEHTVRLDNYTWVPPGWANPLPVMLGPNGHEVKALYGSIDNKGTFPLQIANGDVGIDGVAHYRISGVDVSPGLMCAAGSFSGRVEVTDPGPVAVGETEGGAFDVYVTVAEEAPADCQWDLVSITVSITASTLPAP